MTFDFGYYYRICFWVVDREMSWGCMWRRDLGRRFLLLPHISTRKSTLPHQPHSLFRSPNRNISYIKRKTNLFEWPTWPSFLGSAYYRYQLLSKIERCYPLKPPSGCTWGGGSNTQLLPSKQTPSSPPPQKKNIPFFHTQSYRNIINNKYQKKKKRCTPTKTTPH